MDAILAEAEKRQEPNVKIFYNLHFARFAGLQDRQYELTSVLRGRRGRAKPDWAGPLLFGVMKLEVIRLSPGVVNPNVWNIYDSRTAVKTALKTIDARQLRDNDSGRMLASVSCLIWDPPLPEVPTTTKSKQEVPAFDFGLGKTCTEFPPEKALPALEKLPAFVRGLRLTKPSEGKPPVAKGGGDKAADPLNTTEPMTSGLGTQLEGNH